MLELMHCTVWAMRSSKGEPCSLEGVWKSDLACTETKASTRAVCLIQKAKSVYHSGFNAGAFSHF